MKSLTPFGETKLYSLVHLLNDFIPIGKSIISILPSENLDAPMFIRISLFERYVSRIEFVTPLLKSWENDPNIDDPIGLIIRGCLVDVLSQFYLEEFHSKVKSSPSPEQDEYLRVAKNLLADHIFSGVGHIKKLKDAGIFPGDKYRESVDEWKRLYPNFFDDKPIDYDKPTKSITADQFPTPVQILKLIRNSSLLEGHSIDDLYMCYFFYSKYEHFGVTTNSLQNTDMNMLLRFMMDSFSFIMLGCNIIGGHFVYNFKRFNDENQKMFNIREELVKLLNINPPK